MRSPTQALVLLTGLVAVLVALLAFAVLRFLVAARQARKRASGHASERAFVSVAMQEALEGLQAQEKATSARARASERLSEQIVTSMTAGLLVVSTKGIVEILNPAGRRLLGVGDGEVTGTHRELLAGVVPLADAIDEALATGQPIVRRSLRIDLPTRTMHVGVTVSPLAPPDAADARPTGAMCLFADLTDVIEMEEQLRLQDSLARLGELTAGLAHEFRNGLATIHGYGRLLDPQVLPDPYRSYVEGIRAETDALQKVVTNFLNFARPERVTLHPVELETVVQLAVEDVLPAGGSRGQVELRGHFATVAGDDVMLRQAFSNLLRNAIEACEGAGVAPQLTVIGAVHHDLAMVAIEDNGPGMDAATMQRAFTPFFTTKAQGTGLGLPLVQKIVVTHNGRVSIGRSATGGARFQVALPVYGAASTTQRKLTRG